MGEMADFVNDCSDIDQLYDYGGVLSCRYCNKTDLHWVNLGTYRHPCYRLADDSNIVHTCKKYKPTKIE